jgi:hypothetical protein
MTDPNPYASPRTDANAQTPVEAAVIGAWRQGEFLVMHRDATLPMACVFTNRQEDLVTLELDFLGPGDRRSWELILTRYTATIFVPVRRTVRDHELWMGRLQTWGTVAGVVLALAALNTADVTPLLAVCILGALLAFGTAIYGTNGRSTLTLYDIDEHYLWLRGVSPSYLNRLPVWPK